MSHHPSGVEALGVRQLWRGALTLSGEGGTELSRKTFATRLEGELAKSSSYSKELRCQVKSLQCEGNRTRGTTKVVSRCSSRDWSALTWYENPPGLERCS